MSSVLAKKAAGMAEKAMVMAALTALFFVTGASSEGELNTFDFKGLAGRKEGGPLVLLVRECSIHER